MTAKLIERQIRLFVGFTKAKASEEDIQTLVRVLVSANQEEERFATLMGIPVRLDPDMPEDKIRFENRQGEIVGELTVSPEGRHWSSFNSSLHNDSGTSAGADDPGGLPAGRPL